MVRRGAATRGSRTTAKPSAAEQPRDEPRPARIAGSTAGRTARSRDQEQDQRVVGQGEAEDDGRPGQQPSRGRPAGAPAQPTRAEQHRRPGRCGGRGRRRGRRCPRRSASPRPEAGREPEAGDPVSCRTRWTVHARPRPPRAGRRQQVHRGTPARRTAHRMSPTQPSRTYAGKPVGWAVPRSGQHGLELAGVPEPDARAAGPVARSDQR